MVLNKDTGENHELVKKTKKKTKQISMPHDDCDHQPDQ